MFGFPPLPPIEGLHPIIVHFPIGILTIAWIPMLLGLIDKNRRSGWLLAALLLVVLGTLSLFGAMFTGEETEEFIEHTPQYSTQVIEDAMHEHEELGELTRNLFIGVTAIYLASLILHCKMPEPKKKLAAIVGAVLVGGTYFLGMMALANTGHQGGLLVHDLGIQAPMGSSATNTTGSPAMLGDDDDHDDDDD